MKVPRGDEGFTLIEMMVVVAILSILMMITVASYAMSLNRARRVSCLSNQRALESAIAEYRLDNSGRAPGMLDDLALYVEHIEKATHCPSDRNVHLTFDAEVDAVICPNHPG